MNRFRSTVSLIAAAAALASTAAFGQGVPTETFGSYRGDVTHVGFFDTPIGSNLALQWQFSRPAAHGNASSPVVTGGSVIYGLGKYVYSVSATSGALNWQYPAKGDAVSMDFNCPPAYADGKVYIGNDDGNMYAFDASTGKVIWQTKTSSYIHTAPIVIAGVVYFGSGTELRAVDAVTGKATWPSPLRTDSGIVTSPVVENGDVYVVDGTGTLYAWTALSGRPLWNTRVSGAPTAYGALVYDRSSLFFKDDHTLKVISGRGGDAKSQIDLGSDIIGPITITDDGSYIVTTADLRVSSLDSRGRKTWSTILDDFAAAPALATRTNLFVTTNSGVVYELDRLTGAIKWSYTIQPVSQKAGTTPVKNATIYTSPVVANHTLFILSDDGTLSAFKETAPDNLQPAITAIYPAPDTTVSGKAVPYQLQMADIGSGVKPDSVALTLDGTAIPVDYDVSGTKVHVKNQPGALGQPVTLATLADGRHTATITATDWRGNKLTRSWNFKVDKNLDNQTANTSMVPLATPLGGQTPGNTQVAGNTTPANTAASSSTTTGHSQAGTSESPGLHQVPIPANVTATNPVPAPAPTPGQQPQQVQAHPVQPVPQPAPVVTPTPTPVTPVQPPPVPAPVVPAGDSTPPPPPPPL